MMTGSNKLRSAFSKKVFGDKDWTDLIWELTPVQGVRKMTFKREDQFAPLGPGGINGSKLRQCIYLIHKYIKETKYPLGVVSASSIKSPQVSMGSVVARYFGLPITNIVGQVNIQKVFHQQENMKIAAQMGSDFLLTKCAYNGNLQAKAVEVLKQPQFEGRYYLQYGITTPPSASNQDLEEFHVLGSRQVENLNPKTLVVSAGSCNSLTSILYGLARYQPKKLKTLITIGIGPERLDWMADRLRKIQQVTGLDILDLFDKHWPDNPMAEARCQAKGKTKYNWLHFDLHSTKQVTYQDTVHYKYGNIHFHPRYEGKTISYFLRQFPDLERPQTTYWIVGSEPKMECMPSLLNHYWGTSQFGEI